MTLWRAETACKIGKQALNGETEIPEGATALEYAVYNLLCAVEDLARAEMEKGGNDEMDQR
jgi:hypothetical protein